ncbi:MAG: CBS domain-containing protein [Candidatus Nomurabacteria bacterium]|jgi:CBS domain containing-hemolysin-like protein|nr:CBS domain-containing protein [Candidatus Nomurabacteria bacterium]
MTMVIIVILTALLTALLAFNWHSDVSRFELTRLAVHKPEFKQRLKFLGIFPGLKILVDIVILVLAIAVTAVAFDAMGFVGTLIAFGAILLAFLLSRALRHTAYELVEKNLVWLNKYFAWTEVLGKVALLGDTPRISSRHELIHLIEQADFMDEPDKALLAGAARFPEAKLTDIMTHRSEIIFLQQNDTLGPKTIDELHQTGHKVFPVVDSDIDNIVGVLRFDDVTLLSLGQRKLKEVMSIAPPQLGRHESLETALGVMRRQLTNYLSVTDDKGRTVGMVTLGDVVDVLFGKAK